MSEHDEQVTFFDWVRLNREKSEEIIIWGAQDFIGQSYLYRKMPQLGSNGDWSDGSSGLYIKNANFPKDKPQKFLLVPVSEPNE